MYLHTHHRSQTALKSENFFYISREGKADYCRANTTRIINNINSNAQKKKRNVAVHFSIHFLIAILCSLQNGWF